MQKILRKYQSLKNKKRSRRSRFLFSKMNFHREHLEIPEYSMRMIESSIENFKRGIVSDLIDLSEFRN